MSAFWIAVLIALVVVGFIFFCVWLLHDWNGQPPAINEQFHGHRFRMIKVLSEKNAWHYSIEVKRIPFIGAWRPLIGTGSADEKPVMERYLVYIANKGNKQVIATQGSRA